MSTDLLTEKWAPVIDHKDLEAVKDSHKRAVMAQVLENTERAIQEERELQGLSESSLSGASFGGGFSGAGTNATLNATGRAGYDPIIISLVRRAMPQMMAFDLCGVQPMSAPTGLIFALRARYAADVNAFNDLGTAGIGNQPEAFYQEAFANFSGAPFQANPWTHNVSNAPANYDPTTAGGAISPTNNPFLPARASNVAGAQGNFPGTGGAAGAAGANPTLGNDALVNGPFAGTTGALPNDGTGQYNTNSATGVVQGYNPVPSAASAGAGGAWDGKGVSGGQGGPTGYGMTTRQGEGDNFREMTFTIERTAVEARTRALKSEYTMELVQDLKAVHGLDAEAELSNILSTEILAEINREVVHTLISQAKWGCQGLTSNGVFDLIADGQGRWSVERQKGLMLQIEKECNYIAFETRRGKGNFILCSANVASALTMAGLLDYSSALQDNLNVDVTSGVYAGVLNGRTKVYVDPYATSGDYIVVGYKGSNAMDAGLFYCPYVPLTMVRAVSQDTFQPKIGFKTRYGMVSNPFAQGATGVQSMGLAPASSNVYFRKFRVDNI